MKAQKKNFLFLLSNVLTSGAKIGRDILVGINSVTKSVESSGASVVCVCRDTPRDLLSPLVEACALTRTPIVALPGASCADMANTLSLKRASVLSIPMSREVPDAEFAIKKQL